MRRTRPVITILALILLAAACTAAPVQEMSDARQAIMAAQQVDIDGNHDEALAEALVRLREAEQALREHRFETARTSAVEAHRVAVEVLREHAQEEAAEDGGEATPPGP